MESHVLRGRRKYFRGGLKNNPPPGFRGGEFKGGDYSISVQISDISRILIIPEGNDL